MQPTSQPSLAPSVQPTTRPSSQPTSQPSLQPSVSVCPAGTYRNSFGDCIFCPPGSFNPDPYSGKDSNFCYFCPTGTYCDIAGSTAYTLCPQATFNPFVNMTSILACQNCPAGRTTPFPGATFFSDCLNPAPNFISGFVGLFVAAFLILVYIIRGRFHRVAFVREVRAVNKLNIQSIRIEKTISKMIENIDQRKQLYVESWYEGYVGKVYDNDKYDIHVDNVKTVEVGDGKREVKYKIEGGSFIWWRWFSPKLVHKLLSLFSKRSENSEEVIFESKVDGKDVHRPTSWYMLNQPKSEVISPFQESTIMTPVVIGDQSPESDKTSRTIGNDKFMASGPLNVLVRVNHSESADISSTGDVTSDIESDYQISEGYFALDGNLLVGRTYSKRDRSNLEKLLIPIVELELELERSPSENKKEFLLVYNIANFVESICKPLDPENPLDHPLIQSNNKRKNVQDVKLPFLENIMKEVDDLFKVSNEENSEQVKYRRKYVVDEDNAEQVKFRRECIVDITSKYVDENIRQVLEDHIVLIVREMFEDFVDGIPIDTRGLFFQSIFQAIEADLTWKCQGCIPPDELITFFVRIQIEREVVSYMKEDVEGDRKYRILESVLISPSMKISSFGTQSFNICSDKGNSIFTFKAQSVEICEHWLTQLRLITKCGGLKLNDKVYCKLAVNTWNSKYRVFLFILSSIILVLSTIFILMVINFSQVIFSSLIIWRGIDVGNIDFLKKLQDVAKVFEFRFRIPIISYLLYPLVALIEVLSNIRIDLSSLNVTCSGAQAPLELVIICTILISVVLVIESRFSIFIKVFFRCLNFRFVISSLQYKLKYPAKPTESVKAPNPNIDYDKIETETRAAVKADFEYLLKRNSESLFLGYKHDIEKNKSENISEGGKDEHEKTFRDISNKFDFLMIPYRTALKMLVYLKKRFEPKENRDMSNWLKYYLMFTCMIAGTVGAIDPMQRLLQYMMGFAPVASFVKKDDSVHESSLACDSLQGVPNIDTGNLSLFKKIFALDNYIRVVNI